MGAAGVIGDPGGGPIVAFPLQAGGAFPAGVAVAPTVVREWAIGGELFFELAEISGFDGGAQGAEGSLGRAVADEEVEAGEVAAGGI